MQKQLAKNSLIVFGGTMVANVGAYVFHLIMARLLGPSEYGNLASLMAMMAVGGVITTAIALLAAKFSADFAARKEWTKIRFFVSYLTSRTLIFSLFTVVVIAFVSRPIAHFFQISSPFPVIILGTALGMGFLAAINRGLLQGLQKFFALAVNMSCEGIFKPLLAVLLVILGLKVGGAMGGLTLTALGTYLIALLFLPEVYKGSKEPIETTGLKKYLSYSLSATLFATLIMSLDLLVVKHFFSPQEAGYYGALSTAGKIVLYVTMPIVNVMFPMIADLYSQNKKHYQILLNSLILVALGSLFILVIFHFFSTLVIKILFGAQYLSIAKYLSFYALGFVFYSLNFALIQYYLSIKKRLFLFPLAIATFAEALLLWFYHRTFTQIISLMILVMGLLFVFLVLIYFWDKRSQIQAYFRVKR